MKIPGAIGRMNRDYSGNSSIIFPDRVIAGSLIWACVREHAIYHFYTTLPSHQVLKVRFWASNGIIKVGSTVSVHLDGFLVGDGQDTKSIPAGTIRQAVEDLIRRADPAASKIIASYKANLVAQETETKRRFAEQSKVEAAEREAAKKEAIRRANGGR